MGSPERGRAPFDLRGWFPGLRRREPVGHFERAVAWIDRGRCDEALLELNLALPECADDRARAQVHNKRGVALLQLERREEALVAFCSALEIDERSAAALVNLGNLMYESGHLDDAVDYYQAALRADEKYGLAHANLAAVYKRRGDRSAAVRELRAAAKLAVRRSPGRA
jgi:tetratricopeptide (TPR) repeat protein